MPKTYIVGNWKMNQNIHQLNEFFSEMEKADLPTGNFWIAPQAIHIHPAVKKTNDVDMKIGAQNCCDRNSGAFTGEISPESLKDIEAHFVILGHSERRAIYKENDELINGKVQLALDNKLVPILCVGESLSQREAGKTLDVVLTQVEKGLKDIKIASADELIVAYEPVWAIGTGKTATPEQAEEIHAQIREKLCKIYPDFGAELSILYGGSVKPSNVKDLLAQPNVNGGLVGGASLEAEDYIQLCKAAK